MTSTESSEANHGFTVRDFESDGNEKNFHAWLGKTLAFAKTKGYFLALTSDLTLYGKVSITVEENEFG